MRKIMFRKISAVFLIGALLCFSGCKNQPQGQERSEDVSGSDASGESRTAAETKHPDPAETGNESAAEEGTGETADPEETEADARENASEEDEKISELLSSLPLREKITLLLMPALKSWKEGGSRPDCGGLSDPQLQVLSEYHFGGLILFEENCPSAAQAWAFTDAAQKANREGGACSGLLMAIDQEGGYVTRLSTGTSMPGNMALAASGDPENARTAAEVIGEELRALGIHLNLAPCLDINNNPQNPVIGVRSFSDDPKTVSVYGSAFIDGLHESGTAAALKHFPGHGDTASDSHSGLPTIEKTLQELRGFELVPFAENAGKADAVMTAHISFPLIETEKAVSIKDGREITVPATMSHKLITEVLREELGFTGVVVTDALYMGAVAQHFTALDAAKRALLAGADLLLMPVELTDSEGIAALSSYVDGLQRMAENGEIPMARIDESAGRILRLKAKYGLLREEDLTQQKEPDLSCVGSGEHHEIEWELALKGVTVVKNTGALLPVSEIKKAVVACPYESQLLSVEYAKRRLRSEGVIGEDTEITAFCFRELPPGQAQNYLAGADLVIGIFSMYSAAELDPNSASGQRAAFLDAYFSAAQASGIPTVFVSSQLPYDTERFGTADAVLRCYLAHGMSALPPEDPEYFDIPEYGANLPAAIYRIFTN